MTTSTSRDATVRRSWRRIRRRLGISGALAAAVLGLWVLCAVGWRVLAPHDPFATDPLDALAGPSLTHPLGTDQLGRDVLSRTIAGAEDTLTVAPLATVIAVVGGVALGMLAAHRRGWFDAVTMRLVDGVMAFPALVTTIVMIAMLGRSRLSVATVIGLLFIPPVARTVRTAASAEMTRDYVAAARLLGLRSWRLLAFEVLPNIIPIIAVEATVRLGYAVFAEATLSFLGLGLQPPSPALGVLVAENRSNLNIAPLTVLGPAVAIASIVVAANIVAERLGPER